MWSILTIPFANGFTAVTAAAGIDDFVDTDVVVDVVDAGDVLDVGVRNFDSVEVVATEAKEVVQAIDMKIGVDFTGNFVKNLGDDTVSNGLEYGAGKVDKGVVAIGAAIHAADKCKSDDNSIGTSNTSSTTTIFVDSVAITTMTNSEMRGSSSSTTSTSSSATSSSFADLTLKEAKDKAASPYLDKRMFAPAAGEVEASAARMAARRAAHGVTVEKIKKETDGDAERTNRISFVHGRTSCTSVTSESSTDDVWSSTRSSGTITSPFSLSPSPTRSRGYSLPAAPPKQPTATAHQLSNIKLKSVSDSPRPRRSTTGSRGTSAVADSSLESLLSRPIPEAKRKAALQDPVVAQAAAEPELQQALVALHATFSRHDRNKDGRLTVFELSLMLYELQEPRTPEDIKTLMHEYDDNDDGHIDFGELVAFCRYEGYRDMFKQMDSDGNGELSREEFVAGFTKLGLAGDLSVLYDLADTDSSDSLSYREFATFISDLMNGKEQRV